MKSQPTKNTLLKNAQANAKGNFFKRVFFSPPQEEIHFIFPPPFGFLIIYFSNAQLRKYLLESCNLHTVLDMRQGTFLGAGVKTVVLFFTKGEPTKNIWFYQLDAGKSMGKTNSLNGDDMKEFIAFKKLNPETERSWNIKIANLNTTTYDLGVKNPNLPEEAALQTPQQILEEMETLDADTNQIHSTIKELI